MNQLYYSLFFLWKWSLLTMNTAKVSDNEVSICRRNPCVSKAQASCYSKYSFRHFIFTFGAFLMSYAHISGYEYRSSTYLLFMLSLWGAANQRKVGLKRWTESKSSLFQTEEELRGCRKAMYELTKCYLKLNEVHSETEIFRCKSHASCQSSFKRESHNLTIHLKCLQALIWVR